MCVYFVSMTTSLCNALYVIDRTLQWYCVNNSGAIWPETTQESVVHSEITNFTILHKTFSVILWHIQIFKAFYLSPSLPVNHVVPAPNSKFQSSFPRKRTYIIYH